MTTYKIGGKDYELELKHFGDHLEYLTGELVASDGERLSVFGQNIINVDGNPDWDYAGSGLFWSETKWDDDGLNRVPTEDAKTSPKLTPEEWAKWTAIDFVDSIIENECNFHDFTEDEKSELIPAISEWLTEQYRCLFEESGVAYAACRKLEEEAAEKVTGDN